MSAEFYNANKEMINVDELVSLELSGAGGVRVFPAYEISLVAELGGSCAKVRDSAILTAPTGLPDEFYGNIGESALSSSSSFTLDFHAMDFSVKGGDASDCTARISN